MDESGTKRRLRAGRLTARLAAALTAVCLCGVCWAGGADADAGRRMPTGGLCAHRGDAAAFPENTVPALEGTVRKGAAMVEIDVKRCKTGELVLMHDATVDRTTTGTGKVSALTFAELRALDAGVKKGAAFAGVKIPTFDEAIDCLPMDGLWINIHCKGVKTAREVARKVKAKGRLHQAFVAGRENVTRAARAAVPDIQTCVFFTSPDGKGTPWTDDGLRAYMDYAAREGAGFIQLGRALRDAPAYRDFRARGGRVNYCYGNDADTLARAAELGLEFALTDHLDQMLPFFPTRFDTPPPPAPTSNAADNAAGDPVDVALLRDLVAIPSVSADIPQVNRAMRTMRAWLAARGVPCTLETMPDGHEILYAATTPGKGHDFVLAPHLDVVPAGDPALFTLRRDGDKVFGRGVRDCKGRAVAAGEVLHALLGTGASVGCIFGADEETGGQSTAWMVARGYAPKKMAIVTDSSLYDSLVYAHKGHTLFRVRLTGKGGHSSQPWLCDDLILRAARACTDVRAAWDARHPLAADKWSDILTPTFVAADGGAPNVVPGALEMMFDLRSVTPGAKDEARDLLASATGGAVEVVRHSPPVASDPADPLMARLRRAMYDTLGRDVPFARMFAATDARCFVTCGVPVAMVGTKGHGAHTDAEYDFLSSIAELRTYLVNFLKEEMKR